MSPPRDLEEMLVQLRRSHPRFHGDAYVFVLEALTAVRTELGAKRHVSGQELVDGARGLAMDRYGPLARAVLEHWGIHSTDDLGRLVFALVEVGVLVKREEDCQEDFKDLFDFEEVFDRNYPWNAAN